MTEPSADAASTEPAPEPEATVLEHVAPGREPTPGFSRPRPGWRIGGPQVAWVVLLLVIAAGVLIGPSVENQVDALANPDRAAANAFGAAFASLKPSALVLVAMDADLGTYPEIRGTTEMALQDLLRRGASLAFVSTSVEGRSIAAAQLERLRQGGVPAERLLDLGFVAGAEAGMVKLVDSALRSGMTGPVASQLDGGIGAFDLILVVGGSDVGPRSWVEQVGTRLPGEPMVAIAPTFAQPELAPYVRTGQLDGLLATIRDDASYVQAVRTGDVSGVLPSAFALRIGMLLALVVLLRQLAGTLPRLRGASPVREALDE
jgi:hypothetical protein